MASSLRHKSPLLFPMTGFVHRLPPGLFPHWHKQADHRLCKKRPFSEAAFFTIVEMENQ
jgi:hypothetical protein